MVFCMAYGCSNASNKKGRKSKCPEHVSFHRLPLHDKVQLRRWQVAMKLKTPHLNAYSRVCSEHFEDEMFEELPSEFGVKPKRRLKKDAVPTKFVFSKPVVNESRKERHKLLTEKRRLASDEEKAIPNAIYEDEPSTRWQCIQNTEETPESDNQSICNCIHVAKVNVSTQTYSWADPAKLKHDHCYGKEIQNNPQMPRCKPPQKDSAPMCSTPKKPGKVLHMPEIELSDIESSDSGKCLNNFIYFCIELGH
ncbi:THAP domain-containing protein 5-like [Anneissia japonica]|uniref:THAP domain-containing protein 5-like n=1 Tax=Anneissia japonica TaxID=1529436 RepID=UPI0014258B81|nr:THAP domain-containing protein 5-like [Anneissia japonica]